MAKISTIKQKILEYLDYKDIKKVNFFAQTEINYANFKGKNLESELSGDKIVRILTLYPDISAEWLMRGEGSMLKTSTSSESPCNPITTPSEPSSDSPIALLIKHIDSLTRENERQRLQIATLESRLGQNEA